jgi:hypothetical protein
MPAETREATRERLQREAERLNPTLSWAPLRTAVAGRACFAVWDRGVPYALLIGPRSDPRSREIAAQTLPAWRSSLADFPDFPPTLGDAIDECEAMFALARLGTFTIIDAAPAAETE